LGTVLTVHGVAGGDPSDGLAYLAGLVDGALGGDPAVRVYAQGTESAALLSVTYRGGTTAALDVRAGGTDGPLLTLYGTSGSVEFEPRGRLLDTFDAATGREHRETGVPDGAASGPGDAADRRVAWIVRAAGESMRTGQPVDMS
jgi:hypothetical protein